MGVHEHVANLLVFNDANTYMFYFTIDLGKLE